MHILTLRAHSHLACTFSPCVHILTSRVPSTTQSHLVYTFSPRVHILTLCAHSHLTCPLHHSKSPHVHILTLCAHSHLACPLHHSKSPRTHLEYTLLTSTQNNIFHLAWKNSQKSHAATPIPSIRYLLRATKYIHKKAPDRKHSPCCALSYEQKEV